VTAAIAAILIDEIISHMRTQRNNIQRYRRLLSTKITDQERSFIERLSRDNLDEKAHLDCRAAERRIAEERAFVESLVAANFLLNLRATADTLEV